MKTNVKLFLIFPLRRRQVLHCFDISHLSLL